MSFFVPGIFKFSDYANLVIDDAIGWASTVVWHKVKNISASNEACAIETWQGCCTLGNLPGGTHFDIAMATSSVPVSCNSPRQNTWSYV